MKLGEVVYPILQSADKAVSHNFWGVSTPPTHTHIIIHTHAGTSPFVITGLAQGGAHTFTVTPRQISDSNMPQCESSRRGLIGQSIIIQL